MRAFAFGLVVALACASRGAGSDFALRDGDTVAFLGDSITAARGYTKIVKQCHGRKVRVFICSPAITAEAPDKAEHGFLQMMTDEGMALARSLGAGTIDLQRGMREVQQRIVDANAKETDPKKQTRLHVEDGVHLNDLGQLAMAYAMLKGLGAPADVSSASVDAASGTVLGSDGCTISKVLRTTNGIEFVRLDRGLPLNLGILSGLQYRWVPIPEGINRYRLAVTNLPTGDYEIRAEGRLLGKASADKPARGLNVSSMTADGWEPGGPWDAQSGTVKELVDARDKVWMGGGLRSRYNANHPKRGQLDRQLRDLNDRLVAQQRATARPYPYRFEIRRMK